MHISSYPLARMHVLPRIPPENLRSIGPPLTELQHLGKHILGQYSVMGGPIDLKFSGAILDSTGILARGLMEMCMIHLKIANLVGMQHDGLNFVTKVQKVK